MRSWRVVLVCALVAFLATASAQDAAQCKKDGDAEGAKIASQLCTTKRASCEGGEKAPRALASFFFPEGCGKAFFDACYARSATKMEPCASYKGNAKCALSDFDAIYLEFRGRSCSDAASKRQGPAAPAGGPAPPIPAPVTVASATPAPATPAAEETHHDGSSPEHTNPAPEETHHDDPTPGHFDDVDSGGE